MRREPTDSLRCVSATRGSGSARLPAAPGGTIWRFGNNRFNQILQSLNQIITRNFVQGSQ